MKILIHHVSDPIGIYMYFIIELNCDYVDKNSLYPTKIYEHEPLSESRQYYEVMEIPQGFVLFSVDKFNNKE